MIKYEKEIKSLLRDLFYEKWMDEEDYLEIQEEVFKETGITIQELSNQIEIGINNGYSLDFQLNLMRTKYKK